VIAHVAVTVVAVAVPVIEQLTPLGETVIADAPARLVPVRVTGTLVPRTPVVGLIEDSVGTVIVSLPVALPFGVVTVTVLAPAPAVAVDVQLAVTVDAATVPLDATPVQVTPPPE
jgi:hypothetical protein